MNIIKNKYDFWGLLGLFVFFTLSHIVNFISYIGINVEFLTSYNIVALIKITVYLIIFLLYIRRIDTFLLIGLIILFSTLLLSSLVNYNNFPFIIDIIGEILISVLPLILILIFLKNPDKTLLFMRIVSYPVVILTLFIPFTDGYMNDINYMTLAYSSIINWAVITYYSFREKKLIDIILTILLICNYVLFGTRGSIIIIAVFLLWCLFNFSKNKVVFTILTSFITLILILNYERLLTLAMDFLNRVGIESRTVNAILNGRLLESNSREIIWNNTLNAIIENPFGYGIGYDRVLNNGSYSHNMILELLTSFGVIVGGIILITILIMCFYMLFICKDKDFKALFSIFCLTGLLILQLSYSIFTVYYIYACVTLFYLYTNKNKRSVV